jgi:molecular chaperone GrpE
MNRDGERRELEEERSEAAAAQAGDGSPGLELDEETERREAEEPGSGAGAGATGGDLETELSASRDRYLRLAAEFDNYRKRVERERSEGGVRAQASLVEKLLEPLDDLQRVAHFNSESATAESLLEGVQMVERKLRRVLEAAGLEPIQARGERFDPSLHEALMMVEAESREEDDTVGEVFQTGYQYRGQLLRPARVQVRKHNG